MQRFILCLLFRLKNLKYVLVIPVLASMQVTLYAQAAKKVLNASAINEKITLDGKLDEPAWQHAEKATGFVQHDPYPGQPSIQNTEVKILYDNDAVYVGAMMYDTRPDSILKQLSPRDVFDNNNDVFGVFFDTYADNQNGFFFIVTAAGVQADAKQKFDNSDLSWNAAWFSKVAFSDKGWCVEMKIPYSAIRFPQTDVQKWGINFARIIRRCREQSFWNPVMPDQANFVSQAGIVNGIQNIVSPVRLQLLPYISAYAENYGGVNAHALDGGLDIKYGINDAFTLDMTLVPDFGQTVYDNRVLNLSPIEVRYNDNRYFFTEGLELFNKNDLFYSRRIGGTPVNFNIPTTALNANDTVTSNPQATKLYNATKISGRTEGNLGIGFFNATSAPAYATVNNFVTGTKREIETAPLTNYNEIVLDQAFKNSSYISFVNTNVVRNDTTHNADVTALLFRIADKPNRYAIDGSTDVSQLYYPHYTDIGYRYYLDVGKVSGNYTWLVSTRSISDHFNPNDMGYLDRNNIVYYNIDQYYNIYKPFWIINTQYNHINIYYNRVFNPAVFQSYGIDGSHYTTLKNYLTLGLYWLAQPENSYDYLEPRTAGRYYVYPKTYMGGGFFSSDYRKKFALDGETNYRTFSSQGRNTFYWSLTPRYRFNDKFSMIYSFSFQRQNNDVGYVDNINDSVYFGIRNINTLTSTISASYIFTNVMSLTLNGRQYWSQADYSQYKLLNADGTLGSTTYNTNNNINYNSFNVYLSFVWQFRPGSEMSVVYQNAIYTSGTNMVNDYYNDLNYTLQSPQSNSLSIKVVYYLDYLDIKKALRKSS